jgi:hypothetical protein
MVRSACWKFLEEGHLRENPKILSNRAVLFRVVMVDTWDGRMD